MLALSEQLGMGGDTGGPRALTFKGAQETNAWKIRVATDSAPGLASRSHLFFVH